MSDYILPSCVDVFIVWGVFLLGIDFSPQSEARPSLTRIGEQRAACSRQNHDTHSIDIYTCFFPIVPTNGRKSGNLCRSMVLAGFSSGTQLDNHYTLVLCSPKIELLVAELGRYIRCPGPGPHLELDHETLNPTVPMNPLTEILKSPKP